MTTTDNSRADALKDAVWRLKRDLERGNVGAGTSLVYMADLRTLIEAAEQHEAAPAEPICPLCGDSGYYVVDGPTTEADGHHPNLEPCDCKAEQALLQQEAEVGQRLMEACTDAGCPSGVNMIDWIKGLAARVAQSAPSAPLEAAPRLLQDPVAVTRFNADGSVWEAAPLEGTGNGADERTAQSISDEMMDLVDRLGSEYDKVDPRAWDHMLVYAPGNYRAAKKEIEAINKALRGKVNDPDPLPGLFPHSTGESTTYGLVAGLLRERDALLSRAPRTDVAGAVPDWRELSRRLYVELFHCDQQMRSTRDENGEPHWTQSAVVRDVLADAKAALEALPQPPSADAAAAPADDQKTIPKWIFDNMVATLTPAWDYIQTHQDQFDAKSGDDKTKILVDEFLHHAYRAAGLADERALPQIPDLVKSMAWLTVCLRTELSRLDDNTHKALDEVEAQLCCVRAITNGAIDYEAMVASAAASQTTAAAGQAPAPVCWITKEQLEQLEDLTSDAWVYWRETGHIAEDDELALYTAPPAQVATRHGLTDEQRKALKVALSWMPPKIDASDEIRGLLDGDKQ